MSYCSHMCSMKGSGKGGGPEKVNVKYLGK